MAGKSNRRSSGKEVHLGKVIPRLRSRSEIERIFYRAVDDNDPLNRIEAWQEILRHIVADLQRQADKAKSKGATLEEIGEAFGTSKQNVHFRWFAKRKR